MLKPFSDYLVLLDRALSSPAPSEKEIFHIFHMNGFVQALTVNISREKKTFSWKLHSYAFNSLQQVCLEIYAEVT